MSLTVLRSGMLTTVQDLGRRGYRADGVPLSGAMDPFALRVANLLVGNTENAATLEFTLVGPDLEMSDDALVAVTGAQCKGVRNWIPFKLKRGERLSLGACTQGCRGYVAISGGINVAPVLGSRSTYLRGAWGGFEGRALREGDRLNVGVSSLTEITPLRLGWQIDPRIIPGYSSFVTVRMIPSQPREAWMDQLLEGTFKVSPQSDRMGLRLIADQAPRSGGGDAISAAVVPGTIQVPPDGQPVVLMADAQTIGGYPQAGHVICADLPLLAQLRPGDKLSFIEVSVQEAHGLAINLDRTLAILREGIRQKLTGVSSSGPA